MQGNIKFHITQKDFVKKTIEFVNSEFFIRSVLASIEVIKLLHFQHDILHEKFGLGAGGDNSSGADLLAEAIFCKFLLPVYNIDSEEGGFIQCNIESDFKVILDPLDGSSNFKSNIPYYGASLALCDKNGIVREAFVINYISKEISYLNEKLLSISNLPLLFNLDTLNIGVGRMPYCPMDFSSVLANELNTTAFKNKLEVINKVINHILKTQECILDIDTSFLEELLNNQILRISKGAACHGLECGIFEKASHHPDWVKFLKKNNLKFRSLGATALSLAFSFRYLFVLLPSSVRKYDGMAGFYLAQSQYIYGNVSSYCDIIPSLQKSRDSKRYIIISSNYKIFRKIIDNR